MSFTKAFGFFFIVLSFILFYMNYTFYQKYKSAIKSKRAMFKIESCKSTSGNIKRIIAIGEIEKQNLKGAVNITEYLKYLKNNNPTDILPSSLEVCNEKRIIPIWEYDIGILTGRDTSKNLQSDSIRASNIYQSIKNMLLISIVIFSFGTLLIQKSK